LHGFAREARLFAFHTKANSKTNATLRLGDIENERRINNAAKLRSDARRDNFAHQNDVACY